MTVVKIDDNPNLLLPFYQTRRFYVQSLKALPESFMMELKIHSRVGILAKSAQPAGCRFA